MLRIGSVVLGVSDVPRAVAFWTKALGLVPRGEVEDGWAVLQPVDGAGGGVHLSLGRSETPVQEHPVSIWTCTRGTRRTRPRRWNGW